MHMLPSPGGDFVRISHNPPLQVCVWLPRQERTALVLPMASNLLTYLVPFHSFYRGERQRRVRLDDYTTTQGGCDEKTNMDSERRGPAGADPAGQRDQPGAANGDHAEHDSTRTGRHSQGHAGYSPGS